MGKIFRKARSSHRSCFKGLMSKSDKQHVNKMYSALGTLKYNFFVTFFQVVRGTTFTIIKID